MFHVGLEAMYYDISQSCLVRLTRTFDVVLTILELEDTEHYEMDDSEPDELKRLTPKAQKLHFLSEKK